MDKEAIKQMTEELRSKLDRSEVPIHMHSGIILYIVHAVPPGGFLNAVLRNNLKEACVHADHINISRLQEYVRFLYNDAPMGCWGSDEAVDNWKGLANHPI